MQRAGRGEEGRSFAGCSGLSFTVCVVNASLSLFAVGIDCLHFSNMQAAAGFARGARFFVLATADQCSERLNLQTVLNNK